MLQILDTAGTEQFTAMRDLYLKNGQIFVIMYSVVQPSTFADIVDFIEHVYRIQDCTEVPMVLVGNKDDLGDQRTITVEQGIQLAKKYCIPFVETSAKTGKNIDFLGNLILQQYNPKFGKRRPNKSKFSNFLKKMQAISHKFEQQIPTNQ